jgi:general secretion pathway protein K
MNLSISPQRRQKGVALLVALLVVALATVLIAALLDRGELTAARTRNSLRTSQAESYSQGLEAFAAHVLLQDGANGNDTAGDIWSVPLPPTPVPGGQITATMSDLDGRFNLNNLALPSPQDIPWMEKFQRLLDALKIDHGLAQVVHDWMSASSSVQTGDAYYLGQPVPYRRSRNIFLHVSELRLLKGVSGEVYAQLAPYVSALPPGTPINVNTASVPVLMTLSTATTPITQQTAQALWQQGNANFQTLDDLKKASPGVVTDCGTLPPPGASIQQQQCYGVKSTYFLARCQITLDDLPFVFYSLIERRTGNNAGVRVIQRSRGADD